MSTRNSFKTTPYILSRQFKLAEVLSGLQVSDFLIRPCSGTPNFDVSKGYKIATGEASFNPSENGEVIILFIDYCKPNSSIGGAGSSHRRESETRKNK